MAQQTINIGTSINKGDGDPLRTAFEKVNLNFTELYSSMVTFDSNGNLIANTIGYHTGDIKGSVFADDSSLIIDGINGTIPGYVSINQLKTIVSNSATYADFQAAIAAL